MPLVLPTCWWHSGGMLAGHGPNILNCDIEPFVLLAVAEAEGGTALPPT